ncbi:hypothetical protein AT727_08800 [Desulfitobacterium hafniense]|uniref:Uncharacterized protein n=2 Tax=Desulfitobacterium hafniense TaxID=49338 RepID=A0A0W1JEU2_DESHA|nr:hypothetical protein AT727_08800 [Desulfitobacterium hafniense]
MIYTANARSNVKWDVMKKYYNLNKKKIMEMINCEFEKTIGILESKKIKYQSLKSILTPDHKGNKKEIVFCFDSSKIDSSWYGGTIFSHIIPLLDKKRKHAIFHGDFLSRGLSEDFAYKTLVENIIPLNPTNYVYSDQYFMVYITNLTEEEIKSFIEGLRKYPWFIGYGDMTYANTLKDILAYCLGQNCLQHNNIVIMSHEDDREDSENINLIGYPFENYGFKIISLKQYYYISFLEYKIESRAVDKSDLLFCLNTISNNAIEYEEFDIIVQPEKYKYVKAKNVAAMQKTGIKDMEVDKFTSMLKEKLHESYIYNLEINDYNIAKFNTNIEMDSIDSDEKVKLLASFDYNTEKQQLRLLNLF